MQVKRFIFGLMATLTLLMGVQQPLAAAKRAEKKIRLEKHHKHSSCSSSSHHKKKKCCVKCDTRVEITQEKVGRHGYLITEPGEYFLCEDINYQPKGTNPAIDIAASNVTLDLNGKTLSQNDKSMLEVVGIRVDKGLSNITVKNGTVTSFSKIGIQAGDIIPVFGPLPAGETITNLKISQINAYDNGNQFQIVSFPCALGGLTINNAQDVIVEDSNLNENFLNGFGASGIVKMTIANSHFDDNSWANAQFAPFAPPPPPNPAIVDSQAFGFSLFNFQPSSDIYITNCTFDRTFATGNIGAIVTDNFGGGPTSNMLIESCTANNTTTIVSDPRVVAAIPREPHGIFTMFLRVNNLTVDNCLIYDSSYTVNVPFPPIAGVQARFRLTAIRSIGSNHSITNCRMGGQTFQNNSNVGYRVENVGIDITATPIYIAKCTILGNSILPPEGGGPQPAPSTLFTGGINLDTIANAGIIGNAVVEDCVSSGHTQAASQSLLAPGAFSFVAGYKAAYLHSGSVIFRRCVASHNTDTGSLGGLAFGFTTRDWLSSGNVNSTFVFDSCIAESNTNGTTGCGFDMFNIKGSKVVNCIAEANDIGVQVSDFAPGQSSDNVLSGNLLVANTQFGFLDTSALRATNAYYENRAKNNGPTPAGSSNDTNYSTGTLTFTNAPIRKWLLPALPNTTDNNGILDPVDNLSINL